MILLAIDTSSASGSLALLRDGRRVAEFGVDGRDALSETLLPALDPLLRAAGVGPAGWSAIAVVTGPGSFTGLRVGIAAAKALALATGVPLFGVPAFDALAETLRDVEPPLVGIADARRGRVFAQAFGAHGDGPAPYPGALREPVELSPEEAGRLVPPRAYLAGSGFDRHRDAILALAPPDARAGSGPLVLAAGAAAIAARAWERGDRPHPGGVDALYVRAPGAVPGRGSFAPRGR